MNKINFKREHYKKVTISNILHLKASKMHQINTKISKNFYIGDEGPPPQTTPPFGENKPSFRFASLFLNPGYGPVYNRVFISSELKFLVITY